MTAGAPLACPLLPPYFLCLLKCVIFVIISFSNRLWGWMEFLQVVPLLTTERSMVATSTVKSHIVDHHKCHIIYVISMLFKLILNCDMLFGDILIFILMYYYVILIYLFIYL